ncbi:MAG: M67 family metallopeptidase [Lachnospiraceae bacterium]|nr:M67 family metallopeptidase [Lachnospiraceae bacterium]
MSSIYLHKDLFNSIAGYAREHLPKESCGLIAGHTDDRGRHIDKIYFLPNVDDACDHFSMDPKDQLEAVKDMRKNGYVPLGNWHSHPDTPSRPSNEDVSLAYDPGASYVIISFMADSPVINSFHIADGTVTKEDLRIYSDEHPDW